MATRIELSDIHYRYPDTEWILNGIDMTINPGDYTIVFGTNGSGKSTMGYLFNGLVPHFFEGTLEGTVTVNNIDTKNSEVSELFSQVGLVIQNVDAQLFNDTVENELAFGLESLGRSSGEIDKRITDVSVKLNIADLLDRSPETLSGGEKRLVSIAAILCLSPTVLVLDEPYSNLDRKGIERVKNMLLQIHDSGRSVVVIEQRMGDFLEDATRCVIVERGKIRFQGSTDQANRIMVQEHLVPQYPPRMRKSKRNGNKTILSVNGLSYAVDGRRILRNISLEFKKNEMVAIVGENGVGKTTLIKHFNGLLKPTEGEVMLQGEDIRRKSPNDLARRVGICFQNPNDQFFKTSVGDELRVGPHIIGKHDSQTVDKICSLLDLHGLLDRSPYSLSEGEKKRVAVASILSMEPDILVLDEPTVGQDGRFKEVIANILGDLEMLGITIIIVTHDLEFARATTDRWIVLHDGRVRIDGATEDVRLSVQ